MRDVRKYLATGGALAVLAVSTAIAQQAPTTTPQTQQPNGAVLPQPPPQDAGAPTPETAPRDEGVTPETARDITDKGPETATDITDKGPETATDITDGGPETARDTPIAQADEETAGETRVATAEPAPAGKVVTSETDRDRGVAAPVTDREDPNAPGNSAAPGSSAVRSMAQMQQDSRSGCWVKLFDSPNFAGADVTLVGAASMRALDGTFRSIEVGPAATVTTYRTENFGGSIVRFDPGRKVAQNNDEFASLRITCPNVSSRVTPSRG
jgi:hypothetical protein